MSHDARPSHRDLGAPALAVADATGPRSEHALPVHLGALPNLLDRDGTAVLVEHFLSPCEGDRLFAWLMEHLAWERRTVRVFGKSYEMPRDTAWYGDVGYRYSGVTHPPAKWPSALTRLRRRLAGLLEVDLNSVLANRYTSGADDVGYHSDGEALFGEQPTIASVSLGSTRRFLMQHVNGGSARSIDLSHGSLLIMAGDMQRYWGHALPGTSRPTGTRINLTFRRALEPAA